MPNSLSSPSASRSWFDGRTIEQLSSRLSEIDPPAFPTIYRVRDELAVVVMTVPVGQHQSYSHRGRALRRVGSTNRAMSRDEYHRVLLERLHGQLRWEMNRPRTDRQQVILTLLAGVPDGLALPEIIPNLT